MSGSATPRSAPPSWPSGHSTAAMTMALCAVIVAPPRLRPTVAAVGGAFAVAVAYAILTLGWHFPSDVFGGYLVAATYVLLAVSAIAFSERRWPSRRGAEAGSRPVDVVPAFGVALVGVGVIAGVALARPHALIDYATAHTTFVAGALAIAALAAVLGGRDRVRVPGPRFLTLLGGARLPQRLVATVGRAAQDEEQVREPVEVAHDLRVAVLHQDRPTLGAAADGAADV